MHRILLLLALVLFVFGAGAQEAMKRTRYEIEFNTPMYYDTILKSLDFPMAWRGGSAKKFAKWRNAARDKVIECLGTPPPVAASDYEIVASENRNGYTAHKIEFSVSGYSRIPAYLLVPDGEGPFPALIMLHDHGGQFFIGKEKMVKPFGVEPEVSEVAEKWVVTNYGGRYVGDDYAAAGYVVLSADALYWGERGRREGSTGDWQQALSSSLLQMGMTWTGVITYDDVRSVDFLTSLPFVEPERIGAVGFSMGGHRAWMLGALCERVAATAAICWMNTTDQLMRPGNNQLKGSSSYSMLVPGLRNYLDYPHVASIICPKPLLVFNGRYDKLFPVKGTEDSFAIMRGVWDGQGVGKNLVEKIWDTPHTFNSEMQAEVTEFLDTHLKAK